MNFGPKDLRTRAKDIKIAMDALKTRIITDLDGFERSPLYKRIILSEEAEDALKCITLTSVKSYGLNQTKFFGKIERIHGENTLTETGTRLPSLLFFPGPTAIITAVSCFCFAVSGRIIPPFTVSSSVR